VIFALGASIRAETDEEVEAHKLVLDLTGAFSNDGFKLRDGHWTGTIKPQEHTLIAVNLFAGNQYWFSAATNAKAKKISVDVFDENGKPVVTEVYNSGDKASAGFSPRAADNTLSRSVCSRVSQPPSVSFIPISEMARSVLGSMDAVLSTSCYGVGPSLDFVHRVPERR